ncbi:hypothetical protein [Cryptosporangium phraense]|uniref:Uncharacterized protein n=1 Tax=Cryptosporangium phraense TaxID=2593070 RepID=A0A545AJ37_9ACTN|nr:hypothetical protein [Cryptosporangium phraense]TQS41331.1 hypothetical protein FL583_29920 [Cryptosporangium phraense]
MTAAPPDGWVPVEHRLFGFDRRRFRPALFVLGVALVLIYGTQALNAVIPWNDPTRAGDVLDLGDGATAVPPVGWQLEDGALVGAGNSGTSPTSSSITLAKAGAVIHLQGARFDGSASAFLDQVASVSDRTSAVSGQRTSYTTAAGLVGVVESESGPSGDGLRAAFKLATGTDADAAPALLVVVRTAPGQFERYRDQIDALLSSITPEAAR